MGCCASLFVGVVLLLAGLVPQAALHPILAGEIVPQAGAHGLRAIGAIGIVVQQSLVVVVDQLVNGLGVVGVVLIDTALALGVVGRAGEPDVARHLEVSTWFASKRLFLCSSRIRQEKQ